MDNESNIKANTRRLKFDILLPWHDSNQVCDCILCSCWVVLQ